MSSDEHEDMSLGESHHAGYLYVAIDTGQIAHIASHLDD